MQTLIVLIQAAAELWQVAELSEEGILLVPSIKPQSHGLNLLISHRRQSLVIWILNIPHGQLLPEGVLLRLLEIEDVHARQAILEFDELLLMLLDLLLVLGLQLLDLLLTADSLTRHLLLQVLELHLQLLELQLLFFLLGFKLLNGLLLVHFCDLINFNINYYNQVILKGVYQFLAKMQLLNIL